jgi:hypothetical protein
MSMQHGQCLDNYTAVSEGKEVLSVKGQMSTIYQNVYISFLVKCFLDC